MIQLDTVSNIFVQNIFFFRVGKKTSKKLLSCEGLPLSMGEGRIPTFLILMSLLCGKFSVCYTSTVILKRPQDLYCYLHMHVYKMTYKNAINISLIILIRFHISPLSWQFCQWHQGPKCKVSSIYFMQNSVYRISNTCHASYPWFEFFSSVKSMRCLELF